jgi:hypothetical protein
VSLIERYAGVAPNRGDVVDQMIDFRRREIRVLCKICAPGMSWHECKHTTPTFAQGEQIAGVDLRGRGRRSKRGPMMMSLNGGPDVDLSVQRRIEDGPSRLSTELLRLCGADPDVKHVTRRKEDTRDARDRRKGLSRRVRT